MTALPESWLRERLEVWKWRLGLQNWRIVLHADGLEDEFAYMEVERCVYERAVIRYSPWLLGHGAIPKDVLFQRDDLTPDFVETSLVHELLHLHTRDMSAVVREDLACQLHRDVYDQVQHAHDRAEEQCVDRLAEALVKAFRALEAS